MRLTSSLALAFSLSISVVACEESAPTGTTGTDVPSGETQPGVGDGETGVPSNGSASHGAGGKSAATGSAGASSMAVDATMSPSSSGAGATSSAMPVPVIAGGPTTPSEGVTSSSARPVTEGTSGQGAVAGTMTAGLWDDNLNYDWYQSFLTPDQTPARAGAPLFTSQEREEAHQRALAPRSPKSLLDIALVIDTTGSMGDELTYLQTEFSAMAATISNKYPNAEQRWSLLLYRDEGDDYTLRYFDFRTDLKDYQTQLLAQAANGGGDMPEAVDQALSFASKFNWRISSDAARLVFWVADAPHHEEKAQAFTDAVRGLSGLDIHVYPVASSGVDGLAELSMREAAQMTLGRYIFLTDDSGVGNSHAIPKTPCYYVTGLDDAVLRMVDLEMTGKSSLPAASDIVRTVGSPNAQGLCATTDNRTAQAL